MNLVPSAANFFSYRILSKNITSNEIVNYDSYITSISNTIFDFFQTNNSLKSTYSISNLLVHYVVECIKHLKSTLHVFAIIKLQHPFSPATFKHNFDECNCISCCFKEIPSNLKNIDLLSYFYQLQQESYEVQFFCLTILEKIYEIQTVHIILIQNLRPDLSLELAKKFVHDHQKEK